MVIAGLYFYSPHINLRAATGLPGSPACRFVTAFPSVIEASYPRVHVELVQVNGLAASAKAIETHPA